MKSSNTKSCSAKTKGAEDMLAFQWWFQNLKSNKNDGGIFKYEIIYWMHVQLTILLVSGYQASVEFWRHAGGF